MELLRVIALLLMVLAFIASWYRVYIKWNSLEAQERRGTMFQAIAFTLWLPLFVVNTPRPVNSHQRGFTSEDGAMILGMMAALLLYRSSVLLKPYPWKPNSTQLKKP